MSGNNKIGLTKKHWFESSEYIFPSDVFMIGGMKTFDDFDAIYHYALKRMEAYQGTEMNLYVSGGLSSELLEVLRAAASLDIACNLYYFNKETYQYLKQPQTVIWKPQEKTANMDNMECVSFWSVKRTYDNIFKDIPSIFENEIPLDKLFDFRWMEDTAYQILSPYKGMQLKIYLHGLTQAYVSILNAATRLNMAVTMKIYDFNQDDYVDLDMDRRK